MCETESTLTELFIRPVEASSVKVCFCFRFHAFLKVCQNRSECGRQTLTELFIRPVQRLPSVILLLKDLLKKTDDTNPDHPQLIQV